jgi:hypothetical protein
MCCRIWNESWDRPVTLVARFNIARQMARGDHWGAG